jgi:hypothetical protein
VRTRDDGPGLHYRLCGGVGVEIVIRWRMSSLSSQRFSLEPLMKAIVLYMPGIT